MTNRRARRPASEWAELVAEWRASGQTQREFAAERGLSASTLASWCRKLRDGGQRRKRRRRETRRFTEVRVLEPASIDTPASLSSVVQVTTPSGFVVRVSGQVDPLTLRALLEGLSAC